MKYVWLLRYMQLVGNEYKFMCLLQALYMYNIKLTKLAPGNISFCNADSCSPF
jgi:hypothetical protein